MTCMQVARNRNPILGHACAGCSSSKVAELTQSVMQEDLVGVQAAAHHTSCQVPADCCNSLEPIHLQAHPSTQTADKLCVYVWCCAAAVLLAGAVFGVCIGILLDALQALWGLPSLVDLKQVAG